MTLTLRKRILLLLTPLVILLAGLGGAGVALLQHLGGRSEAILKENFVSILAMGHLNEALERIDSSFQFALTGQLEPARAQYQRNWPNYRSSLEVEQGNITLPGEQELVSRLTQLTERYRQQGDSFYSRPDGDPLRQKDYFDSEGLLATFQQLKAVSGRIARINEANMEECSQAAKRTAVDSRLGFAVSLAIVLLVAAALALGTLRAVLRPIQALTRSVQGISAGNLDQSVPVLSQDELGQLAAAFNQMLEHLRTSEGELTLRARLAAVEAELGQRALTHESVGSLLDAAVSRTAEALGLEYSKVFELLPGAEAFILRSGVGWKGGLVGRATVASGPELQPGYTLRSDKPVVLGDLHTETRFKAPEMHYEHGIVSGMSAKIVTREGPYGVLGVHTKQHRQFSPEEVRFLQAVANLLGLAIERNRAKEALVALNRAYRALSLCNQALIRATDESAWLQQVCQLIVEEAGYRMCWVGIAEEDSNKTVRPVAQAGLDEGYLEQAKITWADVERGRGPTGTCIRTGRTQIARNIGTDPALAPWRAEARKRGYASSIAIPLAVDKAPFGALTIYAAELYAFNPEEQALLSELADDLAYGVTTLRLRAKRAKAEAEIRILNAELEQRVLDRTAELRSATAKIEKAREQEVQIGFKIQQMLLLAQPPQDISGLEVLARTIPSQRIAGDFYSFFKHENQCLDVIVADVMGKGIPAALLGAAAKSHFLEALSHLLVLTAAGELPEPKEIVKQAQTKMARELMSLESFVTLCYARLDLLTRRLTLVDCGHTGLLLLNARTGLCTVVHGDNLPLGIREEENFTQLSIPVETGDLMVLYSDGITEARNPLGELFGEGRLLDCVRANREGSSDALVESIRQAVVAFSKSNQLADDLTCVVIRMKERHAPIAQAELELHSDLKELGRVRDFVRGFCASLPAPVLSPNRVAELELAVTEAASNIMKHAYHGRADQPILVAAEASDEQVLIRLYHVGTALELSAVSPPAFDGSRESGFGVYLIKKSVDDVRYDRDERGRSSVTLVKSRKA